MFIIALESFLLLLNTRTVIEPLRTLIQLLQDELLAENWDKEIFQCELYREEQLREQKKGLVFGRKDNS